MINEKNIFLTVSWLSGLLSAEIFISTGEWGVQMPPLTAENSHLLRSGSQGATLVMGCWCAVEGGCWCAVEGGCWCAVEGGCWSDHVQLAISQSVWQLLIRHRGVGARTMHAPGPCLTTATWCCRKNFSQWECSFLWKLRCHWLKGLRQRQIAVVRQRPGTDLIWNLIVQGPSYIIWDFDHGVYQIL